MNTHVMPGQERRRGERRASTGAAQGRTAGRERDQPMPMASYGRFWAMVAASTVVGFAAMYLNTYQVDHVFFSWTRVFMALIMGGFMTAVMMLFMWKMYPNRRANRGVLAVAALLVLAGTALVRSQATIGDVAYMRAMIPHHSIAILTSSRARIEDPRVRKLADGIIASQTKEIGEMKNLIDDLDHR
jgi:hypothetical protein